MAFFYDFRLEGGVPILRDLYGYLTVAAFDNLLLIAVAAVRIVGVLVFLVAEMFVHLRLEHFLKRSSEQILQRLLDIFC